MCCCRAGTRPYFSTTDSRLLLKFLRKALRPGSTAADLNAQGVAHHGRAEFEPAEACFRKAIARAPEDATTWNNLAATLLAQQKYSAAIPVLRELTALQPQLAEAHLDLGVCHNRLRQNAEAIAHYRRAIALKPALAVAQANLINAYLDSCEWDEAERWTAEFLEYRKHHSADEWVRRIAPYCALSLLPGPICKEVAMYRAAGFERAAQGNPVPAARTRSARRIRIGYVSADFHDHATAHLTFGLYAAHRRDEFEVYAYSLGPDDGGRYRRHIEQTRDRFIAPQREPPEVTARRIADDGIDILIDMKGYTANGRPQIFAHRPAPVQVNYLGYPGTTGARYIDYFISDSVATPPGHEAEFTEQIVRLPGSYQVNDGRQPISSDPVSRSACGLPEGAFVYCSFNLPRKIDRAIFSVWMEILRQVPHAVLWLIDDDALAVANLRKEARARNVDPGRLIFAGRQQKSVHLARHRLADLFLDPHIYNSHTGGSDALWAGLPLVTCPGAAFASRVGASLLNAAGLPELIVHDLDAYRELAVRLAEDRALLATYRMKLEQNRTSCALFDTAGYVRNLESAYRTMLERHQSGRAPESFAVAP